MSNSIQFIPHRKSATFIVYDGLHKAQLSVTAMIPAIDRIMIDKFGLTVWEYYSNNQKKDGGGRYTSLKKAIRPALKMLSAQDIWDMYFCGCSSSDPLFKTSTSASTNDMEPTREEVVQALMKHKLKITS